MKMHILAKQTWGDFDIAIHTPVYASTDKGKLEEKRDELNAARTQEELKAEVSWKITERVTVL